jgi:hypothetical protein
VRRASLLLLLVGACATAGQGKVEPEPVTDSDHAGLRSRKPPAPPSVTLDARRENSLLAVQITVHAEAVLEGEAYEDAETWSIVATDAQGAPLQPVVAAPCKVLRVPVPCASRACNEAPRWNVKVTATRYFAWPDSPDPVLVKVEVPGAGSQETRVAAR